MVEKVEMVEINPGLRVEKVERPIGLNLSTHPQPREGGDSIQPFEGAPVAVLPRMQSRPPLAESGINAFFDRPFGDYLNHPRRKPWREGVDRPKRAYRTRSDGLKGVARMPEYWVWRAMLNRCRKPNMVNWKYYGGRGITVCARWQASFAAFLEDVGRRPEQHYQLDRIDCNGNYEPGNCRWVTPKENMANRRISKKNKQVAA